MSKNISRRDFLKGSAAGAAAMAAAGVLSGFGVTAFAAEEAAEEKLQTKYCNGYDNAAGIGIISEPDVTEDADIVCVGSGIAGFMASMIAKEQGPDLKVVLLEKNGYWGGFHAAGRVQRSCDREDSGRSPRHRRFSHQKHQLHRSPHAVV